MPQLAVGFLALLALWVQTCILPSFHIRGARPDILLILAVFLALYGEDDHWPVRYWLLGLLKDIFSAGPLGLHALLFAFIGSGVGLIRGEVFREHPFTRAFTVFLAVLLANGGAATIHALRAENLWAGDLALCVFAEALTSAVLAPVCMPFFMLFRSLLGIRPARDLSRAL